MRYVYIYGETRVSFLVAANVLSLLEEAMRDLAAMTTMRDEALAEMARLTELIERGGSGVAAAVAYRRNTVQTSIQNLKDDQLRISDLIVEVLGDLEQT